MKKTLLIVTTIAIIFCIISSCTKSNGPGADAVWIQNMAFVPSTVTISVNTALTWTNKDAVTHNVTSDSGWFSSGNIAPGSNFSQPCTSAGTFTYRCTLHSNERGKVIVQ